MKRLIMALLLVSTVVFTAALPAAAWDPFGGASCNGAGANSTVCTDAQKQAGQPNQNPLTGSDGIILKVANLIAVVAGVAAVIIIILAGLRFIQSGGSTEDITGARRAIIYASVGLVVIVLSRTILGLILNAL